MTDQQAEAGDAQRLAIDGGEPVREHQLPYARQSVSDQDIDRVNEVLRSDYLTTGPLVEAFEDAVAQKVNADQGVAVANGTAALHAMVHGIGLGEGHEVIVPSITFAATANACLFEGARPVFADIEPDTLLIDPADVAEKITSRTEAILAVDFAGQPCDYAALSDLADDHELTVLADGCHALGARHRGRPVGSLAHATTFSFHPAKHITSGEGGMVTTDDRDLAERMRRFRNHGITRDHHERRQGGTWEYEIHDPGYNYRLSDIHCALGLSQLERLDGWIERRRELARLYEKELSAIAGVAPLVAREGNDHAYHLFVIRMDADRFGVTRERTFEAMRAEGIGVNVHYIPLHRHPSYRSIVPEVSAGCAQAERTYGEILTLPLFPAMEENDLGDVVDALEKVHASANV